MANGHGGARPGAGRKKKALSEKIIDGNPGKAPLTKLQFGMKETGMHGEDMPPVSEYLKQVTKNSQHYDVIPMSGDLDLLEDAWTWGGNVTFYLPFGAEGTDTYLSFDYFRNDFNKQVIVDTEFDPTTVLFYNLDGQSYTNTYQVDFSVDPIDRFNITATFRYTDAKVTLLNQGLVERPMTSRYKGVLNLQYATAMNKWTFDFTAQLNGPMRLPRFAAEAWGMETSPVYPMFYAQVTRKFRGIDVYAGVENIGGYRQHDAIIGADSPFEFYTRWAEGRWAGIENTVFDASSVWGPLMGRKFYLGLRYTLWK